MKNILLLVTLVTSLFVLPACATAAGPWKGKVIDHDTKEPIEGAAVVAVFTADRFGGGGGPVEKFVDAKETVTDKDGNWEIPAYSPVSMPLIREMNDPRFTIFKPGYGALPINNSGEGNLIDLMASFGRGGGVVELPKLTDKERKMLLLYDLGRYLVGIDKAPNFYKLYNEERKYLGLGDQR